MLEAEVAENFYRKEFTPEEILSTERRRREIEEARRPKGLFERFWNWLRALFKSEPAPEAEKAPKPAPVAPAQEPVKDVAEEPAAEAKAEPEEPQAEPEVESAQEPVKDVPEEPAAEAAAAAEEQPQPEPQQEPEPATETTQIPAPARQPKSAEIVERDGVRHIKWR